MSSPAPDPRLDALLRDLPPPPPVPVGLAERILAAATAMAQEPRPARARRAAARRDRRGRWLGRPLLAGTAALGLLVTSAVAATLAGVPIPQKIAAVFFPGKESEAKQAAEPRRAPRIAPTRTAPMRTAESVPAVEPPRDLNAGPWRRLIAAQRIVEARRAMGLPTPRADRIERQLRWRAEMWRNATPEQRARWLEQRRARQDARRAAVASPEGREALAARQEQIRQWRAQRRAGIPVTPEERQARREQIRRWRAERQAGVLPAPERAPSPEQIRPANAEAQARVFPAPQEGPASQPPVSPSGGQRPVRNAGTDDQRAARLERARRWSEEQQRRLAPPAERRAAPPDRFRRWPDAPRPRMPTRIGRPRTR